REELPLPNSDVADRALDGASERLFPESQPDPVTIGAEAGHALSCILIQRVPKQRDELQLEFALHALEFGGLLSRVESDQSLAGCDALSRMNGHIGHRPVRQRREICTVTESHDGLAHRV